jgi:serine phosphatase RsbU (regulator of sigma subunit)/anti-sigma regulatory factor (Ser/Thr protein kinase)
MPVLATASPALRLRISIACELEKVRPAARAAREFLEGKDVAEEDVSACELALVEACNNAVLYAADAGRKCPVDLEIFCTENAIQLRVHDHTPGFKLTADASLPQEESESGRGLFIIRSMMNRVSYEIGSGGNTLLMVKNRTDSAIDEPAVPTQSVQEFSRKLAESEQIISDMAEELSSCYETLSAIFRCGSDLGKTSDVREFSRSLCEDLQEITDSDWYALRITQVDDPRLTIFAASEPALELEPLSIPPDGKISNSISAEIKAATARHDVWFSEKNPLHPSDPLAQLKPDSFGVIHPFFFAENLMGTLAVGKNPHKKPFTAAQANVIHTFADFLAIQIVNFRFQEEQLKSRLISRELEIARTIQLALLPKILPQPAGFGLAGFCESARQVGGDFYDVVQVSETSLLLIIADVMGKGIPAAMFAAILRSLLRATPEYNQQPAALLSRVNRLLYEELSEVEMFITAQLAFVDLAERKITVASAGHCPLLLAAPGLSCIKAISPDGIPLGILPDATFSDHTEELYPNSRILLYTDGLTDAQEESGSFFGEQRLLNCFRQGVAENQSAAHLKKSLAGELQAFQGQTALYDDQTFLILAEENEMEGLCPKKF